MPTEYSYRIAVIPGDGIGVEVVPEGLKALETLSSRFDIAFDFEHFDWSCERYLATGAMMPDDGIEQLSRFDAIFLGAVGFPTVLDHVSLWGLLIPIRREFQQYINLRPVRLFEGRSEKTAKASIPISVDGYTRAPTMKWRCNNRSLPVKAPIECSSMHLNSPAHARRNA
jgi:tartrate dehydrogenase/decarboxylase/D-malate dehydrogenase